MPKTSAQPAETTTPSKLPELLITFDRASLKEQAEFALMRCASMARVVQEVYGPFKDVCARPLRIIRGGDREPFRCSLDGRSLANDDVLELNIGTGFPEKWLTVWIDGLPDRPFARFLTPYDVGRIELNERSFLRWPEEPDPALTRFVAGLPANPSRREE